MSSNPTADRSETTDQMAAKIAEVREFLDVETGAPLPHTAGEAPDDDDELEDAPIPLRPRPAPAGPEPARRRPTRRPSGQPRTTTSKLARFLPDAERVKLWKRDLGQRRYVRHYTIKDLAHAQDIETFLQTYVVPTYGEGEYDVEVIGVDGAVTRTLTLSVLDPRKEATPPPVTGAAATPLVDNLLGRLLARIDDLENQARQPPKSIAEQIQEVAQIQQMLGGEEKSDIGAVAAIMMAMQGQQASPVAAEIAELKAQLRELARPAPLPLPPAPPPEPQMDWAAVIRETMAAARPQFDLEALANILRPPKALGASDLVAIAAQLAPLLERFVGGRATELDQVRSQQLDLLKEQIRELKSTPSRTIRDVIDDMAALSSFMGAARKSSGQAAESFWGFLGRLVDQFPVTVESLGGLVDKIREEEALGTRTARVREVGPAQPKPKALPDELGPCVQAIEQATDDAGRIEATLRAFQKLGSVPPWRGYLQRALELARAGDKKEALRFIRAFLDGLADAGRLSPSAVEATAKAFETHLDKVIDMLKGAA